MIAPEQQRRSSHAAEPPEELRRRFHAGDPDAMDALAVAFFEDVVRYAGAVLRDDEAAREAAQETFLRIIERHEIFRPDRPFRPWLFAVCRNCCLAILRARGGRAARVVDLEPTEADAERLASEAPTAFERLLREEREREALAAMGTLGEEARSILTLHLFEDLTFREIADVLGRPAPTIATIYYRTLQSLRGELESPRDSRLRHADS